MIVTLNDTTRIDGSDGLNYTLQRKVIVGATGKASKRQGEQRWDTRRSLRTRDNLSCTETRGR